MLFAVTPDFVLGPVFADGLLVAISIEPPAKSPNDPLQAAKRIRSCHPEIVWPVVVETSSFHAI